MKKFSMLLAILISVQAIGQEKLYDSLAVKVLDRMAAFIGDLTSCSVLVDTEHDELDDDFGTLTLVGSHEVNYSGHNKFSVVTENADGKSGYWYNGEKLTYFSYARNHFGFMQTNGLSSVETIDKVHQDYGVDFPAADFFYPTFTDDLLATADRVDFLGREMVEGTSCYKLAFVGPTQQGCIWINDGAYTLPVKFVLSGYADDASTQRYSASFSGWVINPDLPDEMFNFERPPGATLLTIVPKTK